MSAMVLVEREEGWHIGVCRLHRPQVRNALSPELMDQLAQAVEELDRDDSIRCIVIAGSNEVFASGADIRSLSEGAFDQADADPSSGFWGRLARIEKPIIAAVSGWALGGGFELALACDMIVAAEKTQFGQPEVTLGLIPGGGGTQRLARVLGKQRAMELVLTGRRIDAKDARAMGLVNVLAGKRTWFEQAMDLAREVSARGPVAIRLAKQAVLAADRTGLEEGLAIERELFDRAMATEDRVEGMNAFMQGRKPEFEGR